MSSANQLGNGGVGGLTVTVAPKASTSSDAHHLTVAIAGRYKGLVLAVLLILLRSDTMVTCVVALTIASVKLSDGMLSVETSFGQVFDRLGRALWIGATTGVLLGALLTHRSGNSTCGVEMQIVHALIAAPPATLILVGLLRSTG